MSTIVDRFEKIKSKITSLKPNKSVKHMNYENQNKMIEKNIILNSENNSKKAQINLLLLINIILILFIALYVI